MFATLPLLPRAALALALGLAQPAAGDRDAGPVDAGPSGDARPAAEAFDPGRYRAELEAAHAVGAADHELVARKIVSAEADPATGKVTVTDVVQHLDGRTGTLRDQDRCSPCEVDAALWPPRPVGVWFVEERWTTGDAAGRARALERLAHFDRYFQLAPLEEREHQGLTWHFRRFEGRRPVPLTGAGGSGARSDGAEAADREPPDGGASGGGTASSGGSDPAPGAGATRIDIFQGQARPDEILTDPGRDEVALEAVAWAPDARGGLARVERFRPLWSSSCGTATDPGARRIRFRLDPGTDRCRLHVYEARTGAHDAVTVIRARAAPAVRVVLTFEGGQEADAVALTGSARSLDVAARAFDPAGDALDRALEWGVEGGRVQFLDEDRTRLRVHLDPGVDRAVVRVRDPQTGAEDQLVVETR